MVKPIRDVLLPIDSTDDAYSQDNYAYSSEEEHEVESSSRRALIDDEASGHKDENGDPNKVSDEQLLAALDKKAADEKKKTIVRRPQPKLDVVRVIGPKGLGQLPKLFSSVKFKSKGHEPEDLNLLMAHLEHWADRLMPSMRFDDTISRIENSLSSKRPVKMMLTRMRAGEDSDDPVSLETQNSVFHSTDRDFDEATFTEKERSWSEMVDREESNVVPEPSSSPRISTIGEVEEQIADMPEDGDDLFECFLQAQKESSSN